MASDPPPGRPVQLVPRLLMSSVPSPRLTTPTSPLPSTRRESRHGRSVDTAVRFQFSQKMFPGKTRDCPATRDRCPARGDHPFQDPGVPSPQAGWPLRPAPTQFCWEGQGPNLTEVLGRVRGDGATGRLASAERSQQDASLDSGGDGLVRLPRGISARLGRRQEAEGAALPRQREVIPKHSESDTPSSQNSPITTHTP